MSLLNGDLGGFVCLFGTWFLGQDGRYGHVDGRDGRSRYGGGCGCSASRVFLSFSGVVVWGI